MACLRCPPSTASHTLRSTLDPKNLHTTVVARQQWKPCYQPVPSVYWPTWPDTHSFEQPKGGAVATSAAPVLIVIGKSNERAVISLDNERLTIGRGPDNDLVLHDEKLSRHHCVIRRREVDGELEVEDLRSLNGTRVNGRLIKRKVKLTINDTVVLGHTTLIVENEDSPLLDTQAIQTAAERSSTEQGPDGENNNAQAGGDTNADLPPAGTHSQALAGLETEVPGVSPMGTHPLSDGARGGTSSLSEETSVVRGDGLTRRLSQENMYLRRMLAINKQINSDLTPQRVLTAIVDAAIELTGAERGFLLLLNRVEAPPTESSHDAPLEPVSGDDLTVSVARNLDRERIGQPRLSLTIAERVINEDKSLIVADAQHKGELSEVRSIQDLQIQSVLCVPLKARKQRLGALYLDHRWQADAFREVPIEFVEAFAEQAAIAFSNAQLLNAYGKQNEELQEQAKKIQKLHDELEERFAAQTRELATVKQQLDPIGEETRSMAAKFGEIVGSSPALMAMLRTLDKVAPTDLPVFIYGETGTGKELVARALHRHSNRASKPFVAINCKAVSETLLESELFGHVKGAFTGADRDKTGLFEEADGGTLFLDEIGDMPTSMQTKLLRVLESKEFRRVGETGRTREVDVRVVCASHRDIQEMIEEGSFREDLFYRLHNVRIDVPALRERREDIPELVEHFVDAICRDPRHPIETKPSIDPKVKKALLQYHWPGNVRQLLSEVKKLIALREGNTITFEQVSKELQRKPRPEEETTDELGRKPLKDMVDDMERDVLLRAQKKYQNNKTKIAEALGLSRVGLRKKMERLGIPEEPEE